MVNSSMTLAELAVTRPAATRVFWRRRMDFCCGGKQSLAHACGKAGIDPATLVAEIDAEEQRTASVERWDERPLGELIEHILVRYHAPLRRSLPVLVELARKVEIRHADKATCPVGLAALLAEVHEAVDGHLAKEEQVLFPLIAAGRGPAALMPIRVMNQEHDDHGANLRRIRELTGDLTPPAEACNSWLALYSGLLELERELMDHIHLENNVLFPRALAD